MPLPRRRSIPFDGGAATEISTGEKMTTKRKRREVILTIDQALELLKAGSELIYNPHLSIYSLAGKTLRTGVKDQLFRGGYIHEGRYIDPEENAKRRAEEAGRAAEKRAELAAKGQANKRERLDRWCWQIRQCSTDDQIKAALEKFSLWSSVYSLTEDRTDGE